MQDRHAKLKRLALVQRQMERMAELEVAETAREREAVAGRINALVEALASPSPVHSGFSKLYGAQIGKLKIRDQILVGRLQLQQQRMLSERAKADRLGEACDEARRNEERQREELELERLLECRLVLAAQASRKFRS